MVCAQCSDAALGPVYILVGWLLLHSVLINGSAQGLYSNVYVCALITNSGLGSISSISETQPCRIIILSYCEAYAVLAMRSNADVNQPPALQSLSGIIRACVGIIMLMISLCFFMCSG